MDKVQKPSNSECYTPSPEPFRIYKAWESTVDATGPAKDQITEASTRNKFPQCCTLVEGLSIWTSSHVACLTWTSQLTNSLEWRCSWEANRRSPTQEILCPLNYSKVCYRFHKSRHWYQFWARYIQARFSQPTTLQSILILSYHLCFSLLRIQTKICIWLRDYATSRKVEGSALDEVTGFFNWPNPSSRIMALGSTQPLTEMRTSNLPGGKGRPARRAWHPHHHLWADCLEKMWEPRRLTILWASTACCRDSFTYE
jgi:hypothetical protein